jgi:carbamoyl-phosphate synthase large subunit
MPKRKEIKKVLIIGSGPIIIGQACEFDYSGTQACKALKEEGFEVILINSNPATIMTDPDIADRTYIEPITQEVVEQIIIKERPSKDNGILAILPTIGGQTGLNIAVSIAQRGILEKYGVELIGAKLDAILRAEDRFLFKKCIEEIGLSMPKGEFVYNLDGAIKAGGDLGYPIIIRQELKELLLPIFKEQRFNQVLLEESIIGWKEYELEVMRDLNDNVVIICSIENFDPMGIHTGDSITVAPAQTLSDKEYQKMRDAAIRIIRKVGVETGGSNIQFALNPENGNMVVIEMNPRVSRSSALASKATGYPIAKIAAKLAVGYTLDEIPNDITKKTMASFEPVIDYVVTKIPRFAFDKFPEVDMTLNTQMKSVGEVMSIGRTFKESLQKGIRSLEIGRYGLGADGKEILTKRQQRYAKYESKKMPRRLKAKLEIPNWERIFYIREAILAGSSVKEIYNISKIDPWFIYNIKEIVELEREIKNKKGLLKDKNELLFLDILKKAKKYGFSDKQIAYLLGVDELTVRIYRKSKGVKAIFKSVDTCSAEFEAYTPYYYSNYESLDEVRPSKKDRIMILGGGPNRIGQGIEFDYCCVHAAFALKEEGYEVIMVNCNPETVSTDFDTSDRLYFEPLTLEDILNIVDRETPKGVIVQFGGQTPLNLALPLKKEGVPTIGTDPINIGLAEDRKSFALIIKKLGLIQPENGYAMSFEEAREIANKIGFPTVVRPSFVLGGRSMEIVYDDESLKSYMKGAVEVSPDHPVLIDKFLEDAIEIDVDAVSDGKQIVIAGIMEHIEEAGVHSGDSACVLPPYSIGEELTEQIKRITYVLAKELKVCGFMNVQYAIKNEVIYILEVNPRASRTVPFVSKATGIPWAKVATKVMVGKTLSELGIKGEVVPKYISVKESVFPFSKFSGVDLVLGPEMKSTGEVMGIDYDFGMAFAKSQVAADQNLPLGQEFGGIVFISVKNKDKRAIIFIAKKLSDMGFRIISTKGTARALSNYGIKVEEVIQKISDRKRKNVIERIKNLEVDMIINTPTGKGPLSDNYLIRRLAIVYKIPCFTTISGAAAAVNAIESLMREKGLLQKKEFFLDRIKKSKEPYVFVSICKEYRDRRFITLTRVFNGLGKKIIATSGTAAFLKTLGVDIHLIVSKISAGDNNNILKHLENSTVSLILNIYNRRRETDIIDNFNIRRNAVTRATPYITDVNDALFSLKKDEQLSIFLSKTKNIQEYYKDTYKINT